MTIAHSTLALIGNTPLVRLKGPSDESGCEIFGKCEFVNPGASVKDRAALFIVEDSVEWRAAEFHERRRIRRRQKVVTLGVAPCDSRPKQREKCGSVASWDAEDRLTFGVEQRDSPIRSDARERNPLQGDARDGGGFG